MITAFKTEQLDVGFDFDIRLAPDQKIYCFIGKNGIGKTQLLENMAKTLIFTHSMFKVRDCSGLTYGNWFMRKVIYDKLSNTSLKLPLDIELNGIKVKNRNSQNWGFTYFNLIQNVQNQAFICDKPIVFIGAKNRGFAKNIDSSNIKILSDRENRFVDSFERTLHYINGDGLDHQEIADWFASRLIINPSFVVKNEDRGHEAVTVLQLIDKLEPGSNLVTQHENGITLNLIFSEGKLLINGIPLDKLSTGYISIIKIFQEIVAGYSGWSNETNLNEVDGIVFIDEIEPHLHISWQTKIIGVLRDFFPKTTFFISTHSPLVLAGLKSGEGYELVREGNVVKTKAIEHIENYFLNDIVKEFFGVDLNRQKIEHVDKSKQKKAKELLLNLAKTLQEDE